MKKTDIILIIIGILIFLIIAIVLFKINYKKNDGNSKDKIKSTSPKEISVDEETGLYYIKDEETGEIIGASKNKDDLQFYIDNPDYNPNPLEQKITDLKDFIYEN